VPVTAEWESPLELPLEFADQIHVQRVGDRYVLTIGHGNFPLVGPRPVEPFKIGIRPLHRYVVTIADLRRFSDTIASMIPKPENAE
jgi:hypothetical protein